MVLVSDGRTELNCASFGSQNWRPTATGPEMEGRREESESTGEGKDYLRRFKWWNGEAETGRTGDWEARIETLEDGRLIAPRAASSLRA